jgi:hypothetical protein
VEVFQSKLPTSEYTEIARIEVGDTNDDWNLKQVLANARKIGADAVILTGRAGNSAVAVPIGNVAYASGGSYGLTAIAIRYKDRTGIVEAPTQVPTLEQQYQKAQADGKNAALSAPGWFGRGVVFGLLTGPIGVVGGTAIAARSKVEFPSSSLARKSELSPEVQPAFAKAYVEEVQRRRKWSFYKGGVLGFAALAAIAISNAGQ